MSTEQAEETKVEESKVEETKVEEQKEETKTEEKKEPRAYSQEEVDKILAKVRKNERHRTKKEIEAYYKGRAEAREPEKKEAPNEEREPVRGDFESYEAFIEARADYRARKAVKEERARTEKEDGTRREQETRHKTGQEFQRKVREKFPDIEELVEEAGDAPMHEAVQDAIMESAFGPEILYDLLKNPKEIERLATLTQSAAVREIGKLEARFEAKAPKAEAKEAKPASKAPAPVAPPGGASSSSSEAPSDTDDVATWMRKENARLAKLRNQG